MGGSKALDPPPPLIILSVFWVGLLPHLLSLVTGALSGCLLVPHSVVSLCRWQVCSYASPDTDETVRRLLKTCGPFVAQCCQSWLVAQLSRNLTAIPKIPGSNPGVAKFLVCHPLGMPKPRERLGFNLVHKRCSPQNYKRGGGVWLGQKLGGWVQSWVGGSCPKYPPPSYKRSLLARSSYKVVVLSPLIRV